jgi:hypothetical protein
MSAKLRGLAVGAASLGVVLVALALQEVREVDSPVSHCEPMAQPRLLREVEAPLVLDGHVSLPYETGTSPSRFMILDSGSDLLGVWIYRTGPASVRPLGDLEAVTSSSLMQGWDVGPVGPDGLRGVLVDGGGELAYLVASRSGSPSDWMDALEHFGLELEPDLATRPMAELGLPAVRSIHEPPALPGLGSLPISPQLTGFVVSYTNNHTRGDGEDQKAIALGSAGVCAVGNPLLPFQWWYGTGSIDGSSFTASFPSPAENGTAEVSVTLEQGEVVAVATFGLDTSIAAILPEVVAVEEEAWSGADPRSG